MLTIVTVFFTTSGPLSWAVPAELFGTAMRLKGVSWGAITSFAFNTIIGQVTNRIAKHVKHGDESAIEHVERFDDVERDG